MAQAASVKEEAQVLNPKLCTVAPRHAAARGRQGPPPAAVHGRRDHYGAQGSTGPGLLGHGVGAMRAKLAEFGLSMTQTDRWSHGGDRPGAGMGGAGDRRMRCGLSSQGAECSADLDVGCGESCRHVREHYNEPPGMPDHASGAVHKAKARR
jgi:hypothetical protein